METDVYRINKSRTNNYDTTSIIYNLAKSIKFYRMKYTLLNRMPKFLLVLLLAVSFNTLYAVNDPLMKNEDVVSYSALMQSENIQIATINEELAEIEAIIESQGLSYDELATEFPEKVASTSLQKTEVLNSLSATDAPLGINGFFWGFCLGAIGILLVFVLMADSPGRSQQVKNALWGCITLGILYVLLYVVFVVLIGTGTGFWWWW